IRVCGLGSVRVRGRGDVPDSAVSTAGSGFGAMALLVGCERGWITRDQALARFGSMLGCLEKATCYHGMYPHFMRGDTGATIPFSRKDDGADLVESSLLFQGLLCVRAYFDRDVPEEKRLRERISWLWQEAEWNWFTQAGRT